MTLALPLTARSEATAKSSKDQSTQTTGDSTQKQISALTKDRAAARQLLAEQAQRIKNQRTELASLHEKLKFKTHDPASAKKISARTEEYDSARQQFTAKAEDIKNTELAMTQAKMCIANLELAQAPERCKPKNQQAKAQTTKAKQAEK